MAECYIGTSGWTYRHWRGVFYPPELPQARWFEFYASRFPTVEINNTFYRLPDPATFDAWRQQAPRGFVYAVKASRYITHMKKLKDAAEPLSRLLERARRLGRHLGPILYQLPSNWRRDLERLQAFIALLPGDLRHAFEFRDRSWLVDETFEALDRAGVGLCVMDLPGLETPLRVTGGLVYVRFHGPQRAYEGSYSDEELAQWAARLRQFARRRLAIYVYFNNDAHGYAVRDAQRLREMVGCGA
ncbi:MAG: DUF72 domain-containing protein [Anaerolineae bacterium]|nr:DUF72 domain-containing protein [Anaerolineae bacterium]